MKTNDYRCPILKGYGNINILKKALLSKIKIKHKRAKNIYSLISLNNSEYRNDFMKCYDNKCAYCGISRRIIDENQFEIDHFIPKNLKNENTNSINNLVLSCYNCNRKKGDFMPDENILHPDKLSLQDIFVRDDDFYIAISDKYKNNKNIKNFYNQLKFNSDKRRIDFILMYMNELITVLETQRKFKKNNEILDKLRAISDSLREKRCCIEY